MRLLDVGCFNGDSVLHFASNNSFDEIIAFDPNNSFTELWQAISKRYPHVTFHNGAAFTHNGTIEYTQRPENAPLGSTINQDKNDWGMGEVFTVPCYDILEFIVPDTAIKLDGEGSEFDILERIINNDYLKYIPTFYLEWHASKMKTGNYSERQEKILEVLTRENKNIHPW